MSIFGNSFEDKWKADISASSLSPNQSMACYHAMEDLGAWSDRLTTETDDGDFRVRITGDDETILNNIRWVKDRFKNYDEYELTIRRDRDNNTGYITVRANTDPQYTSSPDDIDDTSEDTSSVETSASDPTVSTKSTPNVTSPQSASQAASSASSGLADGASADSSKSVDMDAPNTSEFYLNVLVFLEGVQVPHSGVTVSYGLGSPPSCAIIVPASSVIRDLPECTKVHVFFEDMLADSDGNFKYRLLFDGEMMGYQYNVDGNGATMSINAIHSTAYISLMQILSLDAAEYVFNPNPRMIGDATMPMLFGNSKVNTSIINNILQGKNYESMADIVYQLMRAVLEGTADSAVGKYYAAKLGNIPGGWKILKRVFGVSNKAANAAVAQYKTQYDANGKSKSGTTSSSDTSTGTKYKGAGSGALGWPCSGEITSGFGYRDAPTAGASTGHKGIDIGVDYNTEVHAPADGTVHIQAYDGGYGNWMTIDHNNGLVTTFGHLNEFSVQDGATVKKGDVVALSGSTGTSTGPHLHFGVQNGGEWEDPTQYLG